MDRKDFIKFTASVDADKIIFYEDIWGSQAHALMLAKQKIISDAELGAILKGLEKAKSEFKSGKFVLDESLEDVHMNVEALVTKGAKDAGQRLHTARSRNDQVLVDTKMHLRGEILKTIEGAITLQKVLVGIANANLDTIMPGFTHTQHAQPISLAFWAEAYVSAIGRDIERLQDCYKRVNTNPLGACAMSGTSFPTDRKLTTELLGFDSVHENALDVVSSRDFVIESLSCLSILQSTLSRMAEELVLWSSWEFGFVELDDSYCSGSSIMPQKKNSDLAELVRGKTGHVYGALMNILTVNKGLVLGYNRDFQEDKLPLWFAFSVVESSLDVMAKMLKSAKFKEKQLAEAAMEGFSGATALANYLVSEKNMPFRSAYDKVKVAVEGLITAGAMVDDYNAITKALKKEGVEMSVVEIEKVMSPRGILESQKSMGGTAPSEAKRMSLELTKLISREEILLKLINKRIEDAKSQTEKAVAGVLKTGKLTI
jgi:argininosuccinate lyase